MYDKNIHHTQLYDTFNNSSMTNNYQKLQRIVSRPTYRYPQWAPGIFLPIQVTKATTDTGYSNLILLSIY